MASTRVASRDWLLPSRATVAGACPAGRPRSPNLDRLSPRGRRTRAALGCPSRRGWPFGRRRAGPSARMAAAEAGGVRLPLSGSCAPLLPPRARHSTPGLECSTRTREGVEHQDAVGPVRLRRHTLVRRPASRSGERHSTCTPAPRVPPAERLHAGQQDLLDRALDERTAELSCQPRPAWPIVKSPDRRTGKPRRGGRAPPRSARERDRRRDVCALGKAWRSASI